MEKYPIVSISLINYNGKKFVIKAIESAVNQDYPNLEIIITDNNSTDGTKEEIEKRLPEWEEKRKKISEAFKKDTKCPIGHLVSGAKSLIYIKNKSNAGYGKAHNQAIRISKGDFVLLLNYDAILNKDYIKNVLNPFFEDEKVGSVQGKLLRFDFEKNEPVKSKEDSKFNVIDTTGLLIYKNRRIVCVGQGDADWGQFKDEKEIFGVDGAVPVYRKKALEDTKIPIMTNDKKNKNSKKLQVTCLPDRQASYKLQDCEYFDEDFFMYKEDVDLAWRMRLYGWKAIYAPKAVAYHGRGSGDSMAKNYLDIIKERRKINNKAKYFSFKHQRLMQIKNDFPSLLFTKHFFSFIIKEIGSWMYVAVFERFTIQVLKDFARYIPLFLKKRKIVMKGKRVGAREMEKWFR